MGVPARLYRDTLWAKDVWYMDCPRVPRFIRQRRVALVVDTTDSWAWSGQRAPLIRNVLDEIDRRLESDDRCAVWLLGPRDPVLELTRGPQSQQLAGRVVPTLRSYERGSWLGETLAGVDFWSRCAAAEDREDYLLILSDGEIHDRSVVPLPSAIPPERVLMIVPSPSPTEPEPQRCTTCDRPDPWEKVTIPWSGSLALLDRAAPSIWLDLGAESLGIYRYDQVPITRISGTPRVQPEARLALCFLGGNTPAPALRAGPRTERLVTRLEQRGRPQDAQALQMHSIARLLLATWDRYALSQLVQSNTVDVEHCGRRQRVDRSSPPNEQTCIACGGCLLVQSLGFTISAADDQDKMLLFPLSREDGVVGDAIPVYRPPSTVGKICYDVYDDGSGRFLVLKFMSTEF